MDRGFSMENMIAGVTKMSEKDWKLIQDLATLVDGAYDIVELDWVETPYQKRWKKNWLKNAKKAIDKVVEMQEIQKL
jgi:hypothetical protein